MAFLAVALFIACFRLSQSGPLWPDAPQYTNAAAMIYDWMHSGKLLHPWEFAQANYARYPAFHMPYHPPVFPALLGLAFLVTGISNVTARVFIAVCLWLSAYIFFRILKRMGIAQDLAFGSTLVFLTLPEIAYWSRSTMSEIPGMVMILAATYFFLCWIETQSAGMYVAAFVLAEAAFLSRYLTAGLLLAWVAWALLAGRLRGLLTPIGILIPALFALISGAWTVFSSKYSYYEVSDDQGPIVSRFSPDVAAYHLASLPTTLGWALLAAGLAGMVYCALKSEDLLRRLWIPCWVIGCLVFLLATGIHGGETRYFIYAMPAFPAAVAQFTSSPPLSRVRAVPWAILAVVLVGNLTLLSQFIPGATGHAAIAQRMAAWTEPGNILLDFPLQTESIFLYRAHNPAVLRAFIRGDRTLAVRAPSYSAVPPTVMAKSPEDVLATIRKGRVRYIAVSQESEDEIVLLRKSLRHFPDLFTHIEDVKVENSFTPQEVVPVELWKYTGMLPDGPSELPVIIPTAGLSLSGYVR